jgi:hypothetical protein
MDNVSNECLDLSRKIADGTLKPSDGAMAILVLVHEQSAKASRSMADAMTRAVDKSNAARLAALSS